jgi:Type VI secretion system (T6SS), amidase effector protein 4
MAGFPIPQTYDGARRFNSPIKINVTTYYHLLAVDEVETYLTQQYGPGELVSHNESNKRRKARQVQTYLKGRTGLIVMRDATPGVHTEFWDGSSFLQKDMAVEHLLKLPRVLFWDCTLAPPEWLEDYMR